MENIQIRTILEVLGRPAENVTQALTLLAERLSKEEGVKILEKTIHEPKEVAEAKNLFTSFMEVTLELKDLDTMFKIIMGYMPSNIECTAPEKITIKNEELDTFVNQLVRRLHHYDAVTKKMITDRDFLANKLREVAPHLFKQKPVQEVVENKPAVEKKVKKSKKKKN